jgi:hypothetical protein
MSHSLKVVSIAAVFCESFSLSAIFWRIFDILSRRSPRPPTGELLVVVVA